MFILPKPFEMPLTGILLLEEEEEELSTEERRGVVLKIKREGPAAGAGMLSKILLFDAAPPPPPTMPAEAAPPPPIARCSGEEFETKVAVVVTLISEAQDSVFARSRLEERPPRPPPFGLAEGVVAVEEKFELFDKL